MSFRAIISNFVPSFLQAMLEYWEAIFFTRSHRLWKGFMSYGWLLWILLFGGLIMGYNLLKVFIRWFTNLWTGEVGVVDSAGMLLSSVATEGYELFFMGGMKYIILILAEVLVFHISRRTLEILTGEEQDVRFKTFVQAQIRMIKVVIRSWIKEVLAMALIHVATGLLNIEWLNPPLVFLIQCYYLGFAVMDNYNERYELTIKESIKRIEPYAGAAVGIGLIFYALLLVPFLGAVIAPAFAAVAATLLMYEYEISGKFQSLAPAPSTADVPASEELN